MKLRTTLVAALLAVFAAPALAEGIEIHEAYAFSAYEGSPTGAAFMVLHNHGAVDDRLIGVQSDIAMKVELHQTIAQADGTMLMRPVEAPLDLPVGGEVMLAHGGYHVMFMGLNAPLVDGESITVTLIFEVAGPVEVTVPVDLTPDAMHMSN